MTKETAIPDPLFCVIDLEIVFNDINQKHFDDFLDLPVLRWNSRLRSSAGRFIPGARRGLYRVKPVIEVANYLLDEADAEKHVRDTVAHEAIHYWLWVRQRPYGHTREFYTKMIEMGVSRYNPVPKVKPHRYQYKCPNCEKDFPSRKRLSGLACALCCKKLNGGRFDRRFVLVLAGPAVHSETKTV